MEIIMKKVKTAVWVLIIVFVIVLIYQNQQFFLLTKQSLSLNLIWVQYQTPELEIVYLCGIFFLAGLLLGFYFLTAYGFKTRKKPKALNTQVTEHTEMITSLENELNTIKGPPVAEALPSVDPDAKTVVNNPDNSPQDSEIK
jgi:uncharacterized integral membrane protein